MSAHDPIALYRAERAARTGRVSVVIAEAHAELARAMAAAPAPRNRAAREATPQPGPAPLVLLTPARRARTPRLMYQVRDADGNPPRCRCGCGREPRPDKYRPGRRWQLYASDDCALKARGRRPHYGGRVRSVRRTHKCACGCGRSCPLERPSKARKGATPECVRRLRSRNLARARAVQAERNRARYASVTAADAREGRVAA